MHLVHRETCTMRRRSPPVRAGKWGGFVVLSLLIAQAAGHSQAPLGRWDTADIPVHMHLGPLGADWADAAIAALRAWNEAASGAQFSWTLSSSASAAAGCGQSDGVHTVGWSSSPCVGDWTENLVAITPHWVSSSGTIVDADVIFKFDEGWSASDFERAATHEFGHVLGLSHPDELGRNATAVMGSAAEADTLQSDDIDGVRALYEVDPARATGQPNLVVDPLRASDTSLTVEQSFTLYATVRNAGAGTSAATRLRYYYWRSSTRQWVVVGYDSVPGLAASASSRESILLTAPSSQGNHYYNVCVASVAGESNTRDNCSGNLRVTVGGGSGGPDLVVESARVSDSTLTPGQSFTFYATIRNAGGRTSGETWLRYYHRPPDARSWVRVGGDYSSALPASGTSPESIRLTASSTVGTHWYAACTRSVAGESNRRNNCSRNVRVTVNSGEPPFQGTVWISPNILGPSDRTSLGSVTYAGRGLREVYDRRPDMWITVNAYLFDVHLAAGVVEFQVNPEFGSSEAARAEVETFAPALGRLPAVFLSQLREVEINAGQGLFGGNSYNGSILIHTDDEATRYAVREGFLEEVFLHEGSHVSLDPAHLNSAGWRAAQERDGAFISDYARDYPDREDVAESALPYFAVRYRPGRLTAAERFAIATTIPSRLAYFDEQRLDMSPYTATGSNAVIPEPRANIPPGQLWHEFEARPIR